MRTFRITSESVTEGHPDKLCDQIADHILDAYLEQDPDSRTAIECMVSKNLLLIAGEIKSKAVINVEKIARKTMIDIGYDNEKKGINGNTCIVIKNLNQQSIDICQGVEKLKSLSDSASLGAGDQGMMYGFACDETDGYLPLPIDLAHKLAEELSNVRKKGILAYLRPDGKTQVTVEYNELYQPIRITDIVISAQHEEGISQKLIKKDLIQMVVQKIIPSNLMDENTNVYINPTGRFVIGGPDGDTGLTGRKIIVDTYGGAIPHGGGAFSGKDASKVDRTGAYMCRYVAKNIVAAGLTQRCEISVSYAIGSEKPISLYLNTYHTEKIDKELLYILVENIFDFSISGMIATLGLKKPIYGITSTYGHFKNNKNLLWEKIDKVNLLKECVFNLNKNNFLL